MIKPDEKQFFKLIQKEGCQPGRKIPYDIAKEINMHPMRAHRLYEKWILKGWFEWGVSARTGWITENGMAVDIDKVY